MVIGIMPTSPSALTTAYPGVTWWYIRPWPVPEVRPSLAAHLPAKHQPVGERADGAENWIPMAQGRVVVLISFLALTNQLSRSYKTMANLARERCSPAAKSRVVVSEGRMTSAAAVL